MMFFQQVLSKVRVALALSALPLTLMAVLPTSAKAATLNFDEIYVFGDSLSDTGNVFKASGNTFPPPPYFEGRLSNGPLWVEYLAQSLGLKPNPKTNFAFAGATTGTDNTIDPRLLGLQQEIDGFTASLKQANQFADPNALYIVFAGANDYLPTESAFTPYKTPDTPIANLSSALSSLIGVGAKNIMVPNLPSLGNVPLTLGSPLSAPLNALTEVHNSSLAGTLSSLRQTRPDVNFIPVNVNSLINDAIANPTQFGFTNVTDACLVPSVRLCDNPNGYLFWDQIHPTTAAHKIVANAAYSALSVPEPSDVLGILAVGAFAAVLVVKRKHKQPAQLKAEALRK
jgi:phospholipase/lecithinase/hemolysin